MSQTAPKSKLTREQIAGAVERFSQKFYTLREVVSK